MFNVQVSMPDDLGITVNTTSNRGRTPEEIADRCLEKILGVSNNAPPEIKDQALAYRDVIRQVLIYYMKEMVTSDRTTVYNLLRDAGHPELAEAIRRI